MDKEKKTTHKQPRDQVKSHASWSLDQFIVPAVEGKIRFHDLDLPDEIMHAIADLGFEYCSPVQGQVLPHTLQGLDAIAKAQTGTGKTAAFLVGIIDDLLGNPIEEKRFLAEPRALIIAPTRELVMQIAQDAKDLCKYTQLSVVALVGGMDFGKQQKQLQQQLVDIVVATPGRLIDFVTRKYIHLDMVESLVLDEADRMLDMGFIPQVKQILRATPPVENRQTQLYSATFDNDVLQLAKKWTHEPVRIEIEPEQVATDKVEQRIYMVSREEKFRVLINLLRSPEVQRSIVFVNRRDQGQHLFEKVRKAGIKAGILSGEIPQQKRTRTLEEFKQGKIDVIVATDVMGRGIHVDGVSHVINYNLPDDPEDYVHRIGRTGRAAATGIAITLACEMESYQLPAIEKLLGTKLKCVLPEEALLV